MKLNKIIKSVSETMDFTSIENVKFLNTSDILNNKIFNIPYTNKNNLPGQAKKTIKNGDLLFSEIRPANKRFAFVCLDNPEEYICSTKLMVLRLISNDYIMKYIYYYLTNEKMLNNLQHIAEYRSGTFPQITFDDVLAKKEVKDIPLPTQQHIVDSISNMLCLYTY